MQTAHHVSLTMAAFICNLVFIGVSLGGPTLAWVDSHFAMRRLITIAGALASALLISLIIYVPQFPLWMVGTLTLLLGFASSAYVLTFVIANEIAPIHIRSTCVGFTNMLSVGSAPVLQPLAGLLLALSSHHSPHYTVHEYQIALTILPLGLLISAILAQYLPPFKG